MRVLAIGDTHGNTSAICNVAIPQAKKHDCTSILHAGDFGYWEHYDEGRRFLDKVSKHLVRNDLTLRWIDGNHENHPKLWAEYPPTTVEGLCELRPNLFYVPRGTVFSLGHVTFLGLGGAFSIDKDWRLAEEEFKDAPGTLWWDTEMIRPHDAYLAKENAEKHGPIDVMLTHDCPEGVDIPGIHATDKWRFPGTAVNRELLRDVFDFVQPKLLIHGHYHVRYTSKLALRPNEAKLAGGVLEWDYCRIEGLGNDGFPGFAIVLDLESLFPTDV